MKHKFLSFLMVFAMIAGFTACSDRDDTGGNGIDDAKKTTHIGLTISLSKASGLRASDDNPYNYQGQYVGVTEIQTLDLYLISSDGATLLDAHRFTAASDLVFGSNGGTPTTDLISLKTPYKTTPGDKKLVIIINSPLALATSVIDTTYSFALSGSLTMSQLAKVDNSVTGTLNGTTVGSDVLVLTGKTGVFTIQDGISAQEVTATGKNTQLVNVTRIPSRAIVTTSASNTIYTDTTKTTVMGTISDLTYSVAQGANTVYYFPRTDGGNPATTVTWGYDWMPTSVANDYSTTAGTYYDYSDLQNLSDAIPAKPADNFVMLPGKFLLENTHALGADLSTTHYRKGNTAYVLIRAKFTPNPAIVKDSGTLPADGTFYVGATDGRIYTSADSATSYNSGLQGQNVYTYTNGKVLYYVWLNPDVITKPVNSPVIRNNIYHINISSFKTIGYNWNPLVPPVIKNPDPEPLGPEPPSPIDPNDPLSSTDTYMSVDVTVLPWTVHSYDIDL